LQRPRGYGGTAILWRNDIDKYINVLPDGSGRIICIEINIANQKICCINLYMPARGKPDAEAEFAEVLDEVEEIVKKYGKSHSIIIMGDLNASLNRDPPYQRDKILKKFCHQMRISTDVKENTTFYHHNGKDTSQIDYIFIVEDKEEVVGLQSMQTPDEISAINVSDHEPVFSTVKLFASDKPSKTNDTNSKKSAVSRCYSNSKTDWSNIDIERYNALIEERINAMTIDSNDKLIKAIDELTTSMLSSSIDCMTKPLRKGKRSKKGLDIWNPTINSLVKAKKAAFFEWKEAGRPSDPLDASNIKKKRTKCDLRSAIRRSSRDITENHLNEISNAHSNDDKLFHKLVKAQRAEPTKFTNRLLLNDEELTEPDGICDGFREHFKLLADKKVMSNADTEETSVNCSRIPIIEDLCGSNPNVQPVTLEELKKIISSFKNGKSQDPSNLTAEHLKYAGDNTINLLAQIINYMLTTKYVPSALTKGILTPILKKQKDKTSANNYRGITVTSILCKLLEKVWLLRAEPILDPKQNQMQRGFTKNTSPSNAALLVTESINEAKDKKEPIYVTLLDVSKAFDVVDHEILMEELFHAGIEGDMWLLFKELYNNASTAIKWNGYLSEEFIIKQGVRQGGVTSAPVYKVYTNRLLNQLTEHHNNHRIGTVRVPVPTCADDSAILSNSQADTQKALNIVESYAKSHKYNINASKSATIAYNSAVHTKLTIDGEPMPYCEEATHLGIARNASNSLDTDERIQRARRTMYALMGAGLHGRNGLPPHLSYHIWCTYVLPRMLYGIEATSYKKADICKMEKFQRRMLRQLQFLPSSPAPANAAIYGLIGAKPVEALVDAATLALFGNIVRDTSSAENEIAIRQLAVKTFKSNSWFMRVRELLNKYDLPSIYDLMNTPPAKDEWKKEVHGAIETYWNASIMQDAETKSSLRHLNTSNLQTDVTHQLWSTLHSSPREVEKASIKARLLTDTYVLQSNRAKFNQFDIDDTCPLCAKEAETRAHFLLRCSELEKPRKYFAEKLEHLMYTNLNYDTARTILTSSSMTLQVILDSSHPSITELELLPEDTIKEVEMISRGWCFTLHQHRCRRIRDLVTNC